MGCYFPYIGNNHPNWLICFKGIETTNQDIYIYVIFLCLLEHVSDDIPMKPHESPPSIAAKRGRSGWLTPRRPWSTPFSSVVPWSHPEGRDPWRMGVNRSRTWDFFNGIYGSLHGIYGFLIIIYISSSNGYITISLMIILIWLVVWNMNFDFPYIGNVIITTDELIFFRGVGIPPTRWLDIANGCEILHQLDWGMWWKYEKGFKWFQHVSTIRLVVQDFATIHSMTQPSFEPRNWKFDMVWHDWTIMNGVFASGENNQR